MAKKSAAKKPTKKERVLLDRNSQAIDKLEITYVPIDSIKPNPYNPNRQSAHDFEMLCKSIATDGFTQPIIVQQDSREIIDGEHRWRALRHLGHDEAPVVLTPMTAAQMRISTLRHNRARGSEEPDLVVELYRELAQMGATDQLIEELALDPKEIEKMLEIDVDSALADLEVTISDSALGPDGKGLSDSDKLNHVDLTADQRRAREEEIKRMRGEEEDRLAEQDGTVYRLMLIYSGEEANLVKRVLSRLGAGNDPHAIVELCRWAS